MNTIKHGCNAGDLIACMAAMKAFYEKSGKKVRLVQQLDIAAEYYAGAIHGTLDDAGTMVCMNKSIFNMLKPLIESQEYIESMEVFEGQKVDIDFDVIRNQVFVNIPNGMIQSWVMFAFPNLDFDLSRAWITGDFPEVPQVKDRLIVNFTERYRNPHIHYFFLKEYQDKLIFAGTEKEHKLFAEKWKLDIDYLSVQDFYSLAAALKSSKGLLGNQSMCWNISEAMKIPRILEICQFAVNCLPFVGEKSYGFYHQVGVEYYVKQLIG